jgi:sterol desaturase/sphingolipid hydroxylase (fatty acid hydroxylase superfamily)
MIEFLTAHPQLLLFVRTLVQATGMLIVLTLVFAPLEAFFAERKAKFLYPGFAIDLGWYFLNALAIAFVLTPPMLLIAKATHALLPSALTGFGAHLPLWLRMITAMVVGEVGFYWGHRWCHEIPLLWRFHAVHHSAGHVGFLVNTRAHPVDLVFIRLCGFTLLFATGLADAAGSHPGVVVVAILWGGSVWSYFIHANIRARLGAFEEILASPFFHHWHHTKLDHKDHNYASMLPVMDRIFGTFYAPKHWPAEYGIEAEMAESIPAQLVDPLLART